MAWVSGDLIKTRIIYNVFFHEKKRQKIILGVYNEASFEQKSEWRLDYIYNTNHIAQHLSHLKKLHPHLTIYLRCSEYLEKKLLATNAALYKTAPKSLVYQFLSELKDYGFNQVLSLALTLNKPKYSRRYSSESFRQRTIKADARETALKLISLYNSHQVDLIHRRDEKNRKVKAQHRRRSEQKRTGLIVRKSKSKLTDRSKP